MPRADFFLFGKKLLDINNYSVEIMIYIFGSLDTFNGPLLVHLNKDVM